MKIPTFFKTKPPRGFSFEPRYYDAQKEKMQERMQQAEQQGTATSTHFNFRAERKSKESASARVVFFIAFTSILIVLMISYYFLKN